MYSIPRRGVRRIGQFEQVSHRPVAGSTKPHDGQVLGRFAARRRFCAGAPSAGPWAGRRRFGISDQSSSCRSRHSSPSPKVSSTLRPFQSRPPSARAFPAFPVRFLAPLRALNATTSERTEGMTAPRSHGRSPSVCLLFLKLQEQIRHLREPSLHRLKSPVGPTLHLHVQGSLPRPHAGGSRDVT